MSNTKTADIVAKLKQIVADAEADARKAFDEKIGLAPSSDNPQVMLTDWIKWYGQSALIAERKIVILFHLNKQIEKMATVGDILKAVQDKQKELKELVIEEIGCGSGGLLNMAIHEARQTANARVAERTCHWIISHNWRPRE